MPSPTVTLTTIIDTHALPLAREFRISRGAKTHADVVRLTLSCNGVLGRSECVPYARYGETTESVIAQIEHFFAEHSAIISQLLNAMSPKTISTDSPLFALIMEQVPAGAAANAIDCAMWDWLCKYWQIPISQLLSLPACDSVVTAQTLSLDSLTNMQAQAHEMQGAPLIKIKFDNQDVVEKMQAIAAICTTSRFIIDANEAWSIEQLNAIEPMLVKANVVLIEQPLPAADDDALLSYTGAIPLCADESCHTVFTLADLLDKYQAINIKLDKTGGFTSALKLIMAAKEKNLHLMLGCMVGSSLAMAPNRVLAGYADFIDLDGPLLVRQDIDNGYHIHNGIIEGHSELLWG